MPASAQRLGAELGVVGVRVAPGAGDWSGVARAGDAAGVALAAAASAIGAVRIGTRGASSRRDCSDASGIGPIGPIACVSISAICQTARPPPIETASAKKMMRGDGRIEGCPDEE
jgi:hypothetical protein